MKSATQAQPRICAVICTYQRYDLLAQAIASLQAQSLSQADYTVLIVDNSPPNPHAEEFKQKYHKRGNICYHTEPVPGLSHARNKSLELTSCDIVAYMDDDAEADTEWLKAILEAFDCFGNEAAVAGGPVSPIWASEPPLWLTSAMWPLLSLLDWGEPSRIAAAHEWFAGTNIAFRREPLAEAGGFASQLGRNGSFTLESGEESDVVNRLRERRKQAVWAPQAKMRHHISQERLSQAWLRKRKAWQAVSDFRTNPGNILDRDGLHRCVMGFMDRAPSSHRNYEGLFQPVEDADLFTLQLEAVYAATALLLRGGMLGEAPGIGAAFQGRGMLSILRLLSRRAARSLKIAGRTVQTKPGGQP